MKFDFTPAQKSAISSKDGNILVSAAAGSGKTAVLSERLARSICSDDDPTDISEVLVVTFTRAAATSLKEKIAEKLKEKIKECKDAGKNTDGLLRQLMCVNSASISTIHSFCFDLIKQNFKELSLSPSVKIGDDTQMKVILSEVCESVIDRWYAEHPDEFEQICEVFVSVRDNILAKKFITLYEKLRSYVDGVDVLLSGKLQNSSTEDAVLLAQSIVCAKFERDFELAEKVFESAVNASLGIKETEIARYPMYLRDLEYVQGRKAKVIPNNIESYIEYMGEYSQQPLGNLSKQFKDDYIVYFDAFRGEFKKKLGKYINDYTSKVDTDYEGAIENTRHFCIALHAFMKDLDQCYLERKRELALLDYTDLERFAVLLLANENIADGVKKRYKRIYIDEYQDISPLQDEIFKRISTDNRFMVGDIKQSIYRFRGAAPDLFSDYRSTFEDHDPDAHKTSARIFLSENFRCDQNVIDFSNMVFEKLFKNNSGKVEYRKEDALVFSKVNDDSKRHDYKTSIVMIESAEKDHRVDEAKWVAKEIEKLMASGVQGKHIAIILRSTKNTASIFENALLERGIKSCGGSKSSFFNNPEILLALSMLNVIDNPSRDIWLAGALKSPTLCFTADELVRISAMKKGSLYKSLVEYTKENDFEKGRAFLEMLEKLRIEAQSEPSNVILRKVYQQLGVKYDVLTDRSLSVIAKDNLDKLYEIARSFESSSFRGLHAFIRHIDAMMEKEFKESEDDSKYPDEYVRIMSVHHSKGLEFPVCFICDTAKQHNLMDSSADFLVNDKLGVGMRFKDSTGFLKYETLPRRAMSILSIDDCLDEEMRGLYVALTRAKEKLYVVASGKNIEKKAAEYQLESGFACAGIYMGFATSYFQWIMTSLDPSASCYELSVVNACDEASEASEKEAFEDALVSEEFEGELSTIKENLEFVKQIKERSQDETIPAKMSVSVLTPCVLDDDGSAVLTNSGFADKPDFMTENAQKASATDRGIATHMFMQFCDFDSVDRFGVLPELARLVSMKFLDTGAAELVDTKKLEAFFASDLYLQMKRAKTLYREKRFNVMLPAKDFTKNEMLAQKLEKDNAQILVQGVMDCFFELDDGTLCIVDYKTDRVGKDKTEAKKMLLERYRDQLSYYKRACEIITGGAVSKLLIWSFGLSDVVEILN